MNNFTKQLFNYVYEKEVENVCDYYSLLRRSVSQSSAEVKNEVDYTSTDIVISKASTLSIDDIFESLIEKIITIEDELFLTKLTTAVSKTGNRLEAYGTITLPDVCDTAALLEKTNQRVDKYILPRGMIFDFIKSEFKDYVDPCCDRELLLCGNVGNLYGANLTTVSAKVKKDTTIMKDNTVYAVTGDKDLGVCAFANSIKYDSEQDILTIIHKVYCEINESAVASLAKIQVTEETIDE